MPRHRISRLDDALDAVLALDHRRLGVLVLSAGRGLVGDRLGLLERVDVLALLDRLEVRHDVEVGVLVARLLVLAGLDVEGLQQRVLHRFLQRPSRYRLGSCEL